jgi:hypothetical protein
MRKFLTFLIALGAIVLGVCSPAIPASFFLFVQAPSASTPFGLSYIGSNNSTTAGSSFTFTSQSIGAADPTRIVVVALAAGPNAATVSNVTIGGTNANHATSSYQTASDNSSLSDIWYLAVSSGTTATIVVTFSGSENRCLIEIYGIIGTGSGFSAGGGAGSSWTVSSLSASVSIPSGGGAIAVAGTHSTITGAFTPTNLTMDDNNNVIGGGTYGAGHNTTNSGATSMGVSWSGGGTAGSISIAAFSP